MTRVGMGVPLDVPLCAWLDVRIAVTIDENIYLRKPIFKENEQSE